MLASSARRLNGLNISHYPPNVLFVSLRVEALFPLRGPDPEKQDFPDFPLLRQLNFIFARCILAKNFTSITHYPPKVLLVWLRVEARFTLRKDKPKIQDFPDFPLLRPLVLMVCKLRAGFTFTSNVDYPPIGYLLNFRSLLFSHFDNRMAKILKITTIGIFGLLLEIQ